MAEFARQEEEAHQKKRQQAALEKASVIKEWEWQAKRREVVERELGLEKIG